MIRVDIGNSILKIKRVEPRQLSKLLEWYNRTEDYSYATGMAMPVTLEELGKSYFDALHSRKDVFLGIHTTEDDCFIGMFKCRFSRGILWIYSLMIDRDFQNRGFGSMALSILLSHLKSGTGIKEVYLSVAEDNRRGRAFWLKNGFLEVRLAKSKAFFNGRECMVIIMKKYL